MRVWMLQVQYSTLFPSRDTAPQNGEREGGGEGSREGGKQRGWEVGGKGGRGVGK